MSAEYAYRNPDHKQKLGMVYNEDAKFCAATGRLRLQDRVSLAFEDGTLFPEEIYREMHAAFKVDDLQKYIDDVTA